ncbi:MAG: DUF4175 family protein, partial [Hyphomonadaceae bacterium]
ATRRRMTLLAIGRAWWPFLLLVSIFLIAALIGIFDRTEPALAAFASLIMLLGGALLFTRGWRRFERPGEKEAIAVLDQQSDLRPVSSLKDRPADPAPQAQKLWMAHAERLKAAARKLSPPSLTAAWKTLDPYLLRAVLPVAIVSLAILAGADAPGRISRAVLPDYGALMGAGNMKVEAWITPPAYSGRAPIFLKTDMNALQVPEGSEVTLRVQSRSAPRLIMRTEDGRTRQKFTRTPDGAYEIKTVLTADTALSVRWWGERAAWQLNTSPDEPPSARFAAVPTLTANDKTEFTWAVSDDYGVTRLELDITLTEPNPADPFAHSRAPVIMPGLSPKEASETVQIDLTRHRWAGLQVEVRLVATDGAGQEGYSEPHVFVLPDKLFLQPMARAAQEIRVTVLREPRNYAEEKKNDQFGQAGALNTAPMNRLETAPEDVRRAALMLDALTYEAPIYFNDLTQYLALRTARGILEAAPDKTEADTVDPVLWAVALKAEYGSAADARRALMAAKRALEKALREGATEDEIRRLTQAFKDAANNYVAAKLAEAMLRGLPEGGGDTADGEMAGGGDGLGGSDLRDMLNALEDLTETGASDQARQLLSDITNMLENLEFQQGNGSGDGFAMPGQEGEGEDEDDTPEGEQDLSEAIQRLSDLLREQRELNDDTLEAERRGQGMEPRAGEDSSGNSLDGEDGEPGDMPSQAERLQGLAERQSELGGTLDQLAENQGAENGEEGEGAGGVIDEDALEDIGRAQDRAADALSQGQLRRAERNQEQATRMLSDLSRELAEDLDELHEARTGEQARQAGQTDPFGNPVGGANDNQNVQIPEEAERQRAKDILEELRRRHSEATTEEERDYLERLLDRF